MGKRRKRDFKEIVLYVVVILVTLATIALYTPIFFSPNSNKKEEHSRKKNATATPYLSESTSTPPKQ